jgi:hypothetical protein
VERLAITITDRGEVLGRVRILTVVDAHAGKSQKDRDYKTCNESGIDPWVVGREHSTKTGEIFRPDFHFSTRLVSREHAHIWFEGKWTLLNVSQSNPINVLRNNSNIRLCSAKERGQQLLELEDDDVLQFAGEPFSLKVTTVIDETKQQIDDLPTEGGREPRSHIPDGARLIGKVEPEPIGRGWPDVFSEIAKTILNGPQGFPNWLWQIIVIAATVFVVVAIWGAK